MKKFILMIAAISTFLGLSSRQVMSQETATAMAQVSASILIPLSATETSQLNFGRFFPGSLGGKIMISPAGSLSTSLTVVADASSWNPGSFFVAGEEDATFSIALPNGPTTLSNSADSKTIEVSDWMTLPENGQAGIKLTGGMQTVMVGATLKVGSLDENPRGIYTGSYRITFAYN